MFGLGVGKVRQVVVYGSGRFQAQSYGAVTALVGLFSGVQRLWLAMGGSCARRFQERRGPDLASVSSPQYKNHSFTCRACLSQCLEDRYALLSHTENDLRSSPCLL